MFSVVGCVALAKHASSMLMMVRVVCASISAVQNEDILACKFGFQNHIC